MELHLLSWNISWGCMTLNTKDQTSVDLVNKCITKSSGINVPLDKNICMGNVVKYIDLFTNEFDLVGFQEASNYDFIQTKSKKLQNMSYFNSKEDSEDVVTFYNNKKFKLFAAKTGNILQGNGRPYHILFFEDIIYKKNYICINLHNAHKFHVGKIKLEHILSNNLYMAYNLYQDPRTSYNNDNLKLMNLVDISTLINGKKFNVIVLGDFNDEGVKYYENLNILILII